MWTRHPNAWAWLLAITLQASCVSAAKADPSEPKPPPLDDLKERLILAGATEELDILRGIAYTPDGKHLVATSDGFMHVLDADNLKTIKFAAPGGTAMAMHPSGKFIAMGKSGARVLIRDALSTSIIHEFVIDFPKHPPGASPDWNPAEGDAVEVLTFSPDGKYLAARLSGSHYFPQIWIYRTEGWEFVRTVHTDRGDHVPETISFSWDSKSIAVVDWDKTYPPRGPNPGGGAFIYDLESGQLLRALRIPPMGKDPPDGFSLSTFPTSDVWYGLGLFGSGRGLSKSKEMIFRWMPDSERPDVLPAPWGGREIMCAPSGETVIFYQTHIALWDTKNAKTFFNAELPRDAYWLTISSDSKRAAFVQGWNVIYILDIERKERPGAVAPKDKSDAAKPGTAPSNGKAAK